MHRNRSVACFSTAKNGNGFTDNRGIEHPCACDAHDALGTHLRRQAEVLATVLHCRQKFKQRGSYRIAPCSWCLLIYENPLKSFHPAEFGRIVKTISRNFSLPCLSKVRSQIQLLAQSIFVNDLGSDHLFCDESSVQDHDSSQTAAGSSKKPRSACEGQSTSICICC
jgi:hypothetical protein